MTQVAWWAAGVGGVLLGAGLLTGLWPLTAVGALLMVLGAVLVIMAAVLVAWSGGVSREPGR